MSNHTMKKFFVLPLIAALAVFVSCQKQQTEEEKKAEVERQVQERLAAERLQDEKQRLAQDQANLEAREKALADQQSAAAATPEEPTATATAPVIPDRSETPSEKRSTASYGMFYQKLDPYGAWRETADYGYVWQPREAEESRDWRPYTDGRWVYSDAGWTWVSDEPFGWATYHYGRWLRLRRVGWVWVPGDEWAPAWVSWRTSKDYVGWAPLPPEARFDRRSGIHAWADGYYDIGPDQYAFVPSNEFGAQHVRRAVVPAERNVTIVVETTNVTNISYANTTIVNEGPNYEEMRSRSQQPIERYRLRRQSQMNAEIAPATVRGDELEVSAPIIVEIPGMPRPRMVKERVADAVIDSGWTAIADRSAAERARSKIRTEATPPPNAPPKKFIKPEETSAPSSPVAPAATATTTPRATAAALSSATPTVSPSVRIRPSPTVSPRPTASVLPSASPSARPITTPSAPAATATVSSSATPWVSPSVRIRPSPTVSPRPAASVAPSASVSSSARPITTPAASRTAPAATATPTASVSPAARTRPSPSISLRTSPSITPVAKPSVSPATTPALQRKIPPPAVNTPAPTATPLSTAEPVRRPSPALAPVKRPSASPRGPLPTPVATPRANDTTSSITPVPNVPRRTLPRTGPSIPATPPAANPSASPVSSRNPRDDNAKRPGPKRPDQTEGETATPTPAPSTPPQ